LLYHIKNDLENFRRITDGSVIIMGRKTYESLPKRPLPNRLNIILSTDISYTCDGALVLHSLNDVITLCSLFPSVPCFIIGGSSLYEEFLENNLIDEMFITTVLDDKDGDSLFPIINENEWNIFYQSNVQNDEKTNLDYIFTIYKKK
jgi:dihydrofolate reductase